MLASTPCGFSLVWVLSLVPRGFSLAWVLWSAYHLYGKPENSGQNSNGTVHSGGNYPEKSNTFRGITFFPFLLNDRNFLYHLFGLPEPGFMSRESEKFSAIL